MWERKRECGRWRASRALPHPASRLVSIRLAERSSLALCQTSRFLIAWLAFVPRDLPPVAGGGVRTRWRVREMGGPERGRSAARLGTTRAPHAARGSHPPSPAKVYSSMWPGPTTQRATTVGPGRDRPPQTRAITASQIRVPAAQAPQPSVQPLYPHWCLPPQPDPTSLGPPPLIISSRT